MARITIVLGPLAKVILRDYAHSTSVAGNHFLLAALLLFALNPRGAVFLVIVATLVLIFPLSSDLLRRIPRERLLLLPLSPAENLRIKILGIILNPTLWLIIGLPLFVGKRYLIVSILLIIIIISINVITLLWRQDVFHVQNFGFLRYLPILPGPFGGLLIKNIREMFSVLDPYVGIVLSISALIYQSTSADPVPEAIYGSTLLIVLTLSTYAQNLFALDSGGSFERYGILPMPGWKILLSKDLAFLLVLMLLVLPLNPVVGLASGLVLLAFGHWKSVVRPTKQARWCFVAGNRGWSGAIQVVCMMGAGVATHHLTAWVLYPCAAFYLVSLSYFGYRLGMRLGS